MKLNTLVPYLVGVILILSIALLHQCQQSKDTNLQKEAIRSVWKADMAIADTLNGQLLHKLHALELNQVRKDSLHTANNTAQKRTIAYYIRKERNLRPDTLTVTLQDTIYLLASNLVDSLESQISGLKMTDSLKTVLHDSIQALQAKQIVKCDSLLNSALDMPTPGNWGLGGSTGIATVISNGQVHAGFGASFGVTYRIPIGKISLKSLFRKKRK